MYYGEEHVPQTMLLLPQIFMCINSLIQELSLVAIILWLLHWVYAETFGKSQSNATPTVDVVNMAVDSSDDQQMSDSYRGAGESHGRYVRMPN
ncbi:hypothetical protein NP493_338g02023 [Ridgeia piscesae]|uniref:Uncharacterized protein n=1 Tax=Ridgeia piscesae TaxID=27915 RepID=A0AAD9NUC2_RIDPI|nr:hypothetical protein NP493_338g02023 [Ridgeia piscesae]